MHAPPDPLKPTARAAFTLIEMSIVLVIIGLVVGGVLVSKEMIRSATIRKTITQKESFSTAANAFKLKFGCLPGDCISGAALGLSGGTGNRDNIIYTYGNNSSQYWFWQQLYDAKLIDVRAPHIGSYALAGDWSPTCPICNRTTLTIYGPPYFEVGGWQVLDLGAISSLHCGNPAGSAYSAYGYSVPKWRALALADSNFSGGGFSNTIKPADAVAIDLKIDDGKPYTGSVAVFDSYLYSDATCSGNNGLPGLRVAGCTNTTTNAYVTTSDAACFNLLLQAGF